MRRNVNVAFNTPAEALPLLVTQDWGTGSGQLNLETNTTYDAQRRLATRALPAEAAASTAYAYYDGTEALANTCGVTTGAPRAAPCARPPAPIPTPGGRRRRG
ncbi:MAG: hypothetical protein LC708_00045 [Actinobacteria bacterium]|nr:hypothetical protein [Actinomycetota bacterium]